MSRPQAPARGADSASSQTAPGGNGRIDESRAGGRCPRQRKEQIARLDGAAIHRQPRNLDRLRAEGGVVTEEVGELHAVSVRTVPKGSVSESMARYDDYAFTGLSSMPQE